MDHVETEELLRDTEVRKQIGKRRLKGRLALVNENSLDEEKKRITIE